MCVFTMGDFLLVNANCILPNQKQSITVFKSLDEVLATKLREDGSSETLKEEAWTQFCVDVRRCSLCINAHPFDPKTELNVLKTWIKEHYAPLFRSIFICCSQTIFADPLISIQRQLPGDQYVAEAGFPLKIDLETVDLGVVCRLQKKLRIVEVKTTIHTKAIIKIDISVQLFQNSEHMVCVKCTRY